MSGAAAVVVNYKTRDHLVRCVASLRAGGGVGPIVVVDNHSGDGSEEALAGAEAVTFLDTGANLGFGAAANRGVAACTEGYVVIANPDLEVEPGAVAALVAALEGDPGLAAVGPRIHTPDGRLYPSARRFPDLVTAVGHAVLGLHDPDNRFSRAYKMADWDHGRADVDWVAGTCMAVRRSAFEAVGGFDEGYFMYVEDVDLCWRLAARGWRVGYEPDARVHHVIGAASDRHPYRMMLEHHRSLWRFARRTTTGARRALLPAVAAGLAGRTGLAWLHHARRKPRREPSLVASPGSGAP